MSSVCACAGSDRLFARVHDAVVHCMVAPCGSSLPGDTGLGGEAERVNASSPLLAHGAQLV